MTCEHGFSFASCVRCQQKRGLEVRHYACPCGHTEMDILTERLPAEATGFSSITRSCDRCLGSLSCPQQPDYDPRNQP